MSKPWQLYPLGFLFGLGFDTATEIGLFGLSGAEAAHGAPLWVIAVFPMLFAVGMTLIDTLDGMLMLGAYGWAYVNPVRKLVYNLIMTTLSVVIALVVGGLEVLDCSPTRRKPASGPGSASRTSISALWVSSSSPCLQQSGWRHG